MIVKGEIERAELHRYLLEAMDEVAPKTSRQLHLEVQRRLRHELGVLAPTWRRIEVFGALVHLRKLGEARESSPGRWCRGCL